MVGRRTALLLFGAAGLSLSARTSQSASPQGNLDSAAVIARFSQAGIPIDILRIASGAMIPRLEVDDAVLADLRTAGQLPKRGEIVVFRRPDGDGKAMFRVIGLPGDKIAMNSGQMTLNGISVARAHQGTIRRQVPERWETFNVYSETLPEGPSYEVAESLTPGRFDEIPETTVAAGAVYVLGDNRDYADDSREARLGNIPFNHILGRVVYRLRPNSGWLVPPETVPGLD